MKRYERQTDIHGVSIFIRQAVYKMHCAIIIRGFLTRTKPLYTIRNGLIVRVTMGMHGTSCQIDPDYLALLNEVESK